MGEVEQSPELVEQECLHIQSVKNESTSSFVCLCFRLDQDSFLIKCDILNDQSLEDHIIGA